MRFQPAQVQGRPCEGGFDLFSAPRGMGESLGDVGFFEVRVELENFFLRPASSHEADDSPDGDSEPANARLAPHDLRVGGDPCEFLHVSTPSYDAESRPKLSGQLTNAAAQRPPRRASRAHGRAGRRRLEAR